MSDAKPPPRVHTGAPASARDNFLLDWALETWKRSPDRAADGLQRLVTLNTAVLSGTFLLWKDNPTTGLFRWLPLGLFLVSLAVALYGSIPRTSQLLLDDPREVETYKEQLGRFRVRCLTWASAALWVALLVYALGLLV